MKQVLLVCTALAVCALLSRHARDERPPSSPFSVRGIRLGMTRTELVRQLGVPHEGSSSLALYAGRREDLYARFDLKGRVVGVEGDSLEMDGIVCSPTEPYGELPERLLSFLGPPSSTDGGKYSFVRDYDYERYGLTIQMGCGGWYFYLGERAH